MTRNKLSDLMLPNPAPPPFRRLKRNFFLFSIFLKKKKTLVYDLVVPNYEQISFTLW